MSGISKRISGSWVSGDYGIMKTDTDTITTPAVLYLNDTTATVGLKGNTVQNGTPTTTTPIQPSECGERTANLWNLIFTSGYNLNQNTGLPEVYTPNNTRMAILSPVDVTQYNTVTFNYTNETTNTLYVIYSKFSNGNILQRVANLQIPVTIDVSEADSLYICVYNVSSHDAVTDDSISNIMLNTGSTALPYEPYGYKIPILSNSTTTPVYLGEVQSTRRIKKLVLTGTETFGYANSCLTLSFDGQSSSLQPAKTIIICDRYLGAEPKYRDQLHNYQCCITRNYNQIAIRDDNYADTDAWKTYLQQQYTNGTPVTIWYVLATPETATINEPLMKIGDYADEVTGITIPVTAGANTLSIGTTLQPSEVTVNYKGWHPVADVHEAGRTVNIYDKYNTIDMTIGKRYGIYVANIGFYSIYNNTDNDVLWFDNNGQGRFLACSAHSTATVQITGVQPFGFFMPYNDESLGEVTIVQGSTVPDHYIPYIDWD